VNHAHYHPGKPLCKCLSAKLAEALQQYVQGITNANPQPQVPNPAGTPAAVAPPIANPMQVAPVQNPNPIPEAVPHAQNVQNPPPIDNHETHNNEAPAEAKDQLPTDNNGVQALLPKVVDVDNDPNDQPVTCSLHSCTHHNLHIEKEKEEDDGKDKYNLNNHFIDNQAVEGKEEEGEDQDGDALMDTP
jgi:hypothetical protein